MDVAQLMPSKQSLVSISQPIVGGYNDALNATGDAVEYNGLMGGGGWSATESDNYQCMPTAGTISRLFVRLSTAPNNGAGVQSFTFTLMVNGSPSSLSVTISEDDTTGNDTSNSVALVAGDRVSIRCTTSATSPTTPTAAWSALFQPTTFGESILLANTSVVAFTRYAICAGVSSQAVSRSTVQAPVPSNGKLKSLYIVLSADPGTPPDAYQFTLEVDGSASALSVTIVANDTTGNDITNIISVVAGNPINFKMTPIDTPSATVRAAIGMVFVSDTEGESLILGANRSVLTPDVVRYNHMVEGYDAVWSATETDVVSLILATVLKKFYVLASPGAGGSYQVQVRINEAYATPTSMSVTIAANETAGSDIIHTAVPTDGQTCGIEVTGSGGPDSSSIHWGLVAAPA